jgi:hypothetical protein
VDAPIWSPPAFLLRALHFVPDQATVVSDRSEREEQERLVLLAHLAPEVGPGEPAQARTLAHRWGLAAGVDDSRTVPAHPGLLAPATPYPRGA